MTCRSVYRVYDSRLWVQRTFRCISPTARFQALGLGRGTEKAGRERATSVEDISISTVMPITADCNYNRKQAEKKHTRALTQFASSSLVCMIRHERLRRMLACPCSWDCWFYVGRVWLMSWQLACTLIMILDTFLVYALYTAYRVPRSRYIGTTPGYLSKKVARLYLGWTALHMFGRMQRGYGGPARRWS